MHLLEKYRLEEKKKASWEESLTRQNSTDANWTKLQTEYASFQPCLEKALQVKGG